jgi:hypothetical protein
LLKLVIHILLNTLWSLVGAVVQIRVVLVVEPGVFAQIQASMLLVELLTRSQSVLVVMAGTTLIMLLAGMEMTLYFLQ